MCKARLLPAVVFTCLVAFAQSATQTPAFEVASVRPSQTTVGPDYNNQMTSASTGFTARNVTVKRLIAEAWGVQLNQISGPAWIDHSEYDVSARTAEGVSKEQTAAMIKTLLVERFHLRQHAETREMRVYELETGKGGAKIKPGAEQVAAQTAPGFHFHGSMREFADLLAVQFSIPAPADPSVPARAGGPPAVVLDKTGLDGVFDFTVNMQPDPNTDSFTAWRRALPEQLGLTLDSVKTALPVVVVDDALKVPTQN